MSTNLKEARIRKYTKLQKVVEEKGRLPFHRGYQKYAKIMMFIYETLLEMVNKPGLQNNTGLLYKIKFTNNCYFGQKQRDYHGKILFEYGIGADSSRFKSFEIDHISIDAIVLVLNSFAEYYGLEFSVAEEKYTKSSKDKTYIICLPEEA